MERERVVLGHIIANKGIDVNKVKEEVTKKLPLPFYIKGVRSFLGHISF